MTSVGGATGAGSGSAGPWISPQLDLGYESSARWRHGVILEFGCVTSEGESTRFVYRPGGARHHAEAVAVEDPALASWLNSPDGAGISSARGPSQRVSAILTAQVGSPPVQLVGRCAVWGTCAARTFPNADVGRQSFL